MFNLAREAAIVVPVYKSHPSQIELFSFIKCSKILRRYPIILVTHSELDISLYKRYVPDFQVEFFDRSYFEGIEGYNKLLLTEEFYSRFAAHKYILIHQLDALVFKDDLLNWCRKDYDYVGAPWLRFPFQAFISVTLYVSFWEALKLLKQRKLGNPVGNGGLSLRKIESAIRAIRENRDLLAKWKANEDYFWAYFATVDGAPIKIPLASEAINFSVETNPKKAFKEISHQLPFGAHDWESHDRKFWEKLFKTLNYFDISKSSYSYMAK